MDVLNLILWYVIAYKLDESIWSNKNKKIKNKKKEDESITYLYLARVL